MSRLDRGDSHYIEYQHVPGDGPGVLFCTGFNSDMQGGKALALEGWCRETGRQFTRFDYYGHGQSSGDMVSATVGRWRDDTLAVLDVITSGPQIIVGSSLGGWIALLAAVACPDIVGLVGIAPAPDFTRRMRKQELSVSQQQQLETEGYCELPSSFPSDRPYIIGRDLLEEAQRHLLLGTEVAIDVPVRLLHGQCDDSVPWQLSLELAQCLRTRDVEIQLIKSGDHRLSEPADLQRLLDTVEQLIEHTKAQSGLSA